MISRAQYGAPSDFDEWAKVTGDPSYSWDQFGAYFRKFEKYAHDPRYPDVNLTLRGANGPMQVGYFNNLGRTTAEFVKTCPEVGIPFSPDFNTVLGTKGVNRVSCYNTHATHMLNTFIK